MAKNIEINVKTANGYELLYPAVNPDILKIDSSNVQVDSTLSEKLGLNDGANMGDVLGKLESGVFYNKSPYQVDNLNTTPEISQNASFNHAVVSNGSNFLWIYFNKNTSYTYGKNELCFSSTLFGESESISYAFNSYNNYTSFRFSPGSLVYHKDVGWVVFGLKIYGTGYGDWRGCILQSSDGKNYKEIEQAKTDSFLTNPNIVQIMYANEKFYIGEYYSDDDGNYGATYIYDKNFSRLQIFNNYRGAVEIAVNNYTNETLLFTQKDGSSNIIELAYSTDGLNFYNVKSSNNGYNVGTRAIGLSEGGFIIKAGGNFFKAKFTTLSNNYYLHTDTILYTYNGSIYGNLEEINGVITSVDGFAGKNIYTEDYGVSWKKSTIPTFSMPTRYGGLYSFIVNNQIYIIPYGVAPFLTSSDGIEYTTTHTEYKNYLLDTLANKLSIPVDQILSNTNNNAKIEYGTYTGTGARSVTLTASFEPKIVFVQGNQDSTGGGSTIAVNNKYGYSWNADGGAQHTNTTWDKTSVCLSNTSSNDSYSGYFNGNKINFRYVILG